jgi:hypothetical protein
MRPIVACLLTAALSLPGPAADTAKVNEAVKRGVEFIKGFHGGGVNPGSHGAGSVALTGMALMATGLDAKDATVGAIANYLRPQAFTNNKTYDNALMTLFFDKLGLPEDEGLIQILGVKLVSGQNAAGGWGYDTWPGGQALDGTKWYAAFRGWKSDGRLHPEVLKLYQATRTAGRNSAGGDDNSNTQFALMAVWVAGRHAVPIRETAALFDNRFLRTQDPQSWGWGYSGFGGSTPSMTCAGLLGLAVAFASKGTAELESDTKPKPKGKKDKDDDDPFLSPPVGPGQKPDDKDKPAPEDLFTGRRKAAIDRGLAALGRILAGNGAGTNASAGSFGGVSDLYFFWSVERVGVAYGVERIGGVDWYEWGAPALLSSQGQNGAWGGSYGDEVGTSFAILFLTRANFAIDLSAKLKGKFGSELRGGHPLLKAIPFQEQAAPQAEPGKPPPKISGIREVTQADGLAEALVNANDETFAKLLKEHKAAKGEQHTAALAFAATRLERERKKQTRSALVERLVRMTPETLKKYTAMPEPELRRAAVLAAAAKDDKTHLPDLIARINDPDDDVVKAARIALRSLAGEDFGPPPDAGEDEKQSVAVKWRHWLASRGGK